jgi:hypothetical protein
VARTDDDVADLQVARLTALWRYAWRDLTFAHFPNPSVWFLVLYTVLPAVPDCAEIPRRAEDSFCRFFAVLLQGRSLAFIRDFAGLTATYPTASFSWFATSNSPSH